MEPGGASAGDMQDPAAGKYPYAESIHNAPDQTVVFARCEVHDLVAEGCGHDGSRLAALLGDEIGQTSCPGVTTQVADQLQKRGGDLIGVARRHDGAGGIVWIAQDDS